MVSVLNVLRERMLVSLGGSEFQMAVWIAGKCSNVSEMCKWFAAAYLVAWWCMSEVGV